MLGVFASLAGLGDEAGPPAPSAPPHFRQKLASTAFTVLQEEQRFSTLVPHFMQKWRFILTRRQPTNMKSAPSLMRSTVAPIGNGRRTRAQQLRTAGSRKADF